MRLRPLHAVFMVVSLVWRVVQGLLYEYPPATGGINQKLPKAPIGDAAAP